MKTCQCPPPFIPQSNGTCGVCARHQGASHMQTNDNNTYSDHGVHVEQLIKELDVTELLEAMKATELAPGVTLMTKDGRSIGNGIVVARYYPNYKAEDLLQYNDVPAWLIETDFGNRVVFNEAEINEFYELGFVRDYDSWWEARMEAIQKSVEDTRQPPSKSLLQFFERLKNYANPDS